MRRRLPLALLALALAWLTLWPVPVDPQPWVAPTPPPLEGDFALDDALAVVERVGEGVLVGPEDVAVAPDGALFTGLADGRLMRLGPDGAVTEVGRTGGRPLGLRVGPDGALVVADALRGLLAVGPDGAARVLATGEGDRPFRFVDGVDLGADGVIWFSDASDRFGLHDYTLDIMEHRGNGRLLRLDPATGSVTRQLDGLQFANGVAVDPRQEFVLVVESGVARVRRLWLRGPKAGQSDVFLDNLPGYPDNLSVGRDGFWLALFGLRDPATERLFAWPWAVRMVARLPSWLLPKPRRHTMVLELDRDGRVRRALHDAAAGYGPVTSVNAVGDDLWLGSLSADGLGRVRGGAR